MFEFLSARAQSNPNIGLHCCFGPLSIQIKCNSVSTFIKIDSHGVHFLKPMPGISIDFVLTAKKEAWIELLKANPRPGFQCLSTMRRTRNLIVTGNLVKFNQHLLLLEMLFTNICNGEKNPHSILDPAIEPITGKYMRLKIFNRLHRLYFEEAGQGIPLICLHTAGSDGRQFRHILNDCEITKRFRVIAFDLPWHGKSSPPAGFEKEIYELTTENYVAIIMTVIQALKINYPVIMGCSIGGRAVLHLALRYGESIRAAIGLQSALYATDRSLGDSSPDMVLHRPDIHGGKNAGASMAGMIAPQSPAAERWETIWHYMQCGPGVFMGDLHYYFKDGDLRNGLADPLRESSCPIYLLSGEYDVSATPEMGKELAELIGASHFEVMREVGHFPMSENPVLFRKYLLPVLDKITQQSI